MCATNYACIPVLSAVSGRKSQSFFLVLLVVFVAILQVCYFWTGSSAYYYYNFSLKRREHKTGSWNWNLWKMCFCYTHTSRFWIFLYVAAVHNMHIAHTYTLQSLHILYLKVGETKTWQSTWLVRGPKGGFGGIIGSVKWLVFRVVEPQQPITIFIFEVFISA